MSRSSELLVRAGPWVGEPEPGPEPVSFGVASWRRMRRDRTAMFGLVGLALVCLLALAAPTIAGDLLGLDPFRQRLAEQFSPPGPAHPLGADEYGRDALARLLYGAQVSMALGFGVAAISLVIGVGVGLVAGYYGGWVDDLLNAVIQVKRAVPFLYLLIMITLVVRPTLTVLLVLFGAWSWTGVARTVRGQTLAYKRRDYVDAARALGASDGRIILRHVLPHISSIVLVEVGFVVAGSILAEAGISFLGFGIQPPTPSWGNMLSNALEYVRRAWWLVAAPGAAISFTVLCVFLLTDGLRDALDPRLAR
ncbi:MAG TPA: ABC transporter permease [Chloroflexota bacterium]